MLYGNKGNAHLLQTQQALNYFIGGTKFTVCGFKKNKDKRERERERERERKREKDDPHLLQAQQALVHLQALAEGRLSTLPLRVYLN